MTLVTFWFFIHNLLDIPIIFFWILTRPKVLFLQPPSLRTPTFVLFLAILFSPFQAHLLLFFALLIRLKVLVIFSRFLAHIFIFVISLVLWICVRHLVILLALFLLLFLLLTLLELLHFLIHLVRLIIFRLIFVFLKVLFLISSFFLVHQEHFFEIQNCFYVIRQFLLGKVYHVPKLLTLKTPYFIVFLSVHALIVEFYEPMSIIMLLHIILIFSQIFNEVPR